MRWKQRRAGSLNLVTQTWHLCRDRRGGCYKEHWAGEPQSLRQTGQVLASPQGELLSKDHRGIPPRQKWPGISALPHSNPGWRWCRYSEALQLKWGPESATGWWGADCIPRSFWKGDGSLAPPWVPQSPIHSQNGPGLDKLHTDYFLCTAIMVQKKADTLSRNKSSLA